MHCTVSSVHCACYFVYSLSPDIMKNWIDKTMFYNNVCIVCSCVKSVSAGMCRDSYNFDSFVVCVDMWMCGCCHVVEDWLTGQFDFTTSINRHRM